MVPRNPPSFWMAPTCTHLIANNEQNMFEFWHVLTWVLRWAILYFYDTKFGCFAYLIQILKRQSRLTSNSQSSCFSLPNAGITSVHHARLKLTFFVKFLEKYFDHLEGFIEYIQIRH